MVSLFSIPLVVEVKPHSTEPYITKPLGQAGPRQQLALHHDGTTVKGTLLVRPRDNSGRPIPHGGIRIRLMGMIRTYGDECREVTFLSLSHELAAPGEITRPFEFPFSFRDVQKQFESYAGINIRVIYFLEAVVVAIPSWFGAKLFGGSDIRREQEIWVHNYPASEDVDPGVVNGSLPKEIHPVKMDVGIEDCLHLEIEYGKSRYHLQDVVVGRVYFLLVRLKLKFMEISVMRTETLGTGSNQQSVSETIVRFEIMDGQPSRGESIPIRLFLGGFDLCPTVRDVGGRFSIRYYLCVVLVDEGKILRFSSQDYCCICLL